MIQLNSEGNFSTVEINDSVLYFSYKTLISIRTKNDLYVSQNYWGTTTGKHLTQIDGGSKEAKQKRLNADNFKQVVDSLFVDNRRVVFVPFRQ
jgi:hypothetical protein